MSGNVVLASSSFLNRLAAAVERASWLDKPAAVASSLLKPLLSPRPVNDVLTGAPLGHPLHPALVAVPIGSWAAASYLDLTGGSPRAARALVGMGCVAALPTALSGAADLLTTQGAERRVGVVHAALNSAALGLYGGSWLARRRGSRTTARALSLAGLTFVSVSGWLGGHLAYALGVGVDTTVFQHFPQDWTDVARDGELGEGRPLKGEVDGVPLLLVRSNGEVMALADRCTHRGGPLHEGQVSGGCVTCPWHGSTFRLCDGEVVGGPATRPQPVLETRVVDGRVQVRRPAEPRTLRTNPVGV